MKKTCKSLVDSVRSMSLVQQPIWSVRSVSWLTLRSRCLRLIRLPMKVGTVWRRLPSSHSSSSRDMPPNTSGTWQKISKYLFLYFLISKVQLIKLSLKKKWQNKLINAPIKSLIIKLEVIGLCIFFVPSIMDSISEGKG